MKIGDKVYSVYYCGFFRINEREITDIFEDDKYYLYDSDNSMGETFFYHKDKDCFAGNGMFYYRTKKRAIQEYIKKIEKDIRGLQDRRKRVLKELNKELKNEN